MMAMITDKVHRAVSDMGFSVSSIQDRDDGCFVRTDDPRQLRPMYQFLEMQGFDARLKTDGVFVADTGYSGKSMHPEDVDGKPIRIGDKVHVLSSGEDGKVIRINPGGYPVVQVGSSANAWQPDEMRVKAIKAKTIGSRTEKRCECGGICYPGKDTCASCAFADGETWATETAAAEQRADREVKVKALREQYSSKTRTTGITVAGRYLNKQDAEAYLDGVVRRLFQSRPSASPQAVIDRIYSQFGARIALNGQQVTLLPGNSP